MNATCLRTIDVSPAVKGAEFPALPIELLRTIFRSSSLATSWRREGRTEILVAPWGALAHLNARCDALQRAEPGSNERTVLSDVRRGSTGPCDEGVDIARCADADVRVRHGGERNTGDEEPMKKSSSSSPTACTRSRSIENEHGGPSHPLEEFGPPLRCVIP